jgi:hypothetical protein
VPQRVAVFIDWQNVYHCAREAFHNPADDPSRHGNLRPNAFAQLLAEKGPADRVVSFIGIYRGQPDPRRDPRTHAAHMRQRQAWEAQCGPLLRVKTRALRYLSGRPLSEADEKGIDVQLAIDVMLMGVANEYDVAILATTDNDLLPVVEGLVALRAANGRPAVEVIGWQGVARHLSVPGVTVRWIGRKDYEAVRDPTDYNIAAAGTRRVRF